MADPDYSFLDRLLHKLALHFPAVAEMSFDLDQILVRDDPTRIVQQRHVFVSGLARAGTSVLMRRFHATGNFRSLTYRDMPFVLAPNFWRRLSQLSRRNLERTERAHGDSVLIDADSPESLDEVFWRIFSGSEYLGVDRLTPYVPDDDVVRKYVRYVNAVLAADEPRRNCYLSKNNNNILRLGALFRAFPRALVLIPFRDPLQHAASLLNQHRRFVELQTNRPFMLSYMNWLGHHEFGLGHRRFRFGDAAPCQFPAESLDYWLHLWCETYSWLEHSKPGAALFVCYEDLCRQNQTWRRLAELAGVLASQESGDAFRLSDRPVRDPADPGLALRSTAIYERLVTTARAALA